MGYLIFNLGLMHKQVVYRNGWSDLRSSAIPHGMLHRHHELKMSELAKEPGTAQKIARYDVNKLLRCLV